MRFAAAPFSKDPELRKIARTLFTQADAIGPVADDPLGGAYRLHREEPRGAGRSSIAGSSPRTATIITIPTIGRT
jgi:hypothetical protein